MKNKLRILIAEDHETVRQGFRLIVEAQDDMEVVGEAGDGRAAVELARMLQPGVVLMDISMPELNGLKAAAKLTRKLQKAPIYSGLLFFIEIVGIIIAVEVLDFL